MAEKDEKIERTPKGVAEFLKTCGDEKRAEALAEIGDMSARMVRRAAARGYWHHQLKLTVKKFLAGEATREELQAAVDKVDDVIAREDEYERAHGVQL